MVNYLQYLFAHSIFIYTFTTSETNNPTYKKPKPQKQKIH